MDLNRELPARARSGSRRDEQARLAVLHAADDLMVERGFARTTVEGIAQRAGVAKQTIYRWWPSKVEILLDGLIEGADKYLFIDPDAASATAVDEYIERFRRFVTTTDDGQVFLALLGHAQHDDTTARLLHDRFLGPRRVQERKLLRRALRQTVVSEGEIDEELDTRVGAVVYRALTARNPGRSMG